MSRSLKIFFINFSALVLFSFDRILKKIFSASSGEYFILGDWLKLKLAVNPGIAFGIRISQPVLVFLFIIILLFLVFYLIKFYREKKYFSAFCFSLIIFGAFSNLLDRFHFGGVVDYIDLKYFTVFNLADVMITGGVVGFLVVSFKKKSIIHNS